jgi:hypothetical protein
MFESGIPAAGRRGDFLMKSRRTTGLFLATIAAAAITIPLVAQQRPSSGPVARYDIRAGTISGIAGMGGGGMMAAMMGGGRSQAQHELWLRLGSSNAPNPGAAKADHFMPPGVKLGKSVALGWKDESGEDRLEQRPKGRILLYWGCGERAPAGQPVVIDFAKVAKGQVPPGLWTSTVVRDWGPTALNSKTFGTWPWDDKKYVKADSMLPGPHRIVSNYAPEINFTLTKDFMQPISARHTAQPSGSTLVNWTGIPDATGYFLFLTGGKSIPGKDDLDTLVMWTSSASRQFGGGLYDWISPSQVSGLIRDRVLLSPSTSSCTIPAEVRRDAPDFRMIMLNAFGPEENFAYPPRPADPKAAWNLQWTARVRHRSSTAIMDIPGMGSMGAMDDDDGGQQPEQKPECKPKRGLGGLGGMLGGAIGGKRGC